MKIYFARHGQDHDNVNGILNGHRDTPLTEVGVGQAQVLADTVKSLNLGIDKIFASPLQRAYKTAEIVADTLGLEKPEKVDLLIERDFGVMSGKEIKNIAELCAPDIIQSNPITYFLSPEGAETFPMLVERGAKITEWLHTLDYENILLVSHGDIGKMLYAHFYNLDWKEVLVNFHFGNSEVLLLQEGCPVEERHVHKVEQYNH